MAFLQLLEQFTVKRGEKLARSLPWLFREWPELNPAILTSMQSTVTRLADAGRWESARGLCREWAPRVIQGFFYFHRYERAFLGAAVAAVFGAWIALVYLSLTRYMLWIVPLNSTPI
jgi:hypothetical protein